MYKKMFPMILAMFFGLFISACSFDNPDKPNKKTSLADITKQLYTSNSDYVLVVAHRGGWRNAPENSLQSIQNCIDLGVDIVEIDVRMTRDSVLILMHDKTIDRTTNGEGEVSSFTYDSLQNFWLVDGLNHNTPNKIPTLEEALLVSKGEILMNLDKSYDLFDQCYQLLVKTGTLDQVLIKGAKSRQVVENEFGKYLDQVNFMPVIRLENSNSRHILEDYLSHYIPVAFEFTIPFDTSSIIEEFSMIQETGARVWVNSLWPRLCAGHDDEQAVLDQSVYDWYIDNNVNIIQTDRPQLLLDYLREKGLHN